VIDGFKADNRAREPWTVPANVFGQLGLFVGRPGDEDGAGICDRFGDGLQIGMILRRMPAADRICLTVNVPGRMGLDEERAALHRSVRNEISGLPGDRSRQRRDSDAFSCAGPFDKFHPNLVRLVPRCH
jgi:hypothetical protein